MAEVLRSEEEVLCRVERLSSVSANFEEYNEERREYLPRKRRCQLFLSIVTLSLGLIGLPALVFKQREDEGTLLEAYWWTDENHPARAKIRTEKPDVKKYVISAESAYERSSVIGSGLYDGTFVPVHTAVTLSINDAGDWEWEGDQVEFESRSGAVVVARFLEVGNEIEVRARHKEKKASLKLKSRIVRRELRTLTHEDREKYVSALHLLYATPEGEGILKYGENYKSANYLIREHLNGASAKECDHYHDDAGMLNHHIGITWQLENSLRLIDESTAAHYWDYSLDAALYPTIQWAQETPVFRKDWFGQASPSDRVITTGRWSFLKIASAQDNSYSNAYGLLRSPWNTNKIPFLMRHNRTLGVLTDAYSTPPSCDEFAHWFNSASSLSEMNFALNGALHGPVHIMIGGLWSFGPEWLPVAKKLDYPDAFLLLGKFLWRQGYARCPTSCSVDTPQEACLCACPALSHQSDLKNASARILDTLTLVDPNYRKLPALLDQHGLSDVDYVSELCHVGHPGDMFTSASPQDPIFWPLHGNAERFIQYARILKQKGLRDFNESWGYAHIPHNPSDTGIICDWDNLNDGMPNCFPGTCEGHKENDLLPFEGLAFLDDPEPSLFTNAEFYQRALPEYLPYVYDSVSYWPGCQGDDIFLKSPHD